MMDNSFYSDLDEYIARGRSLHAQAVRQAFKNAFSAFTTSKRPAKVETPTGVAQAA